MLDSLIKEKTISLGISSLEVKLTRDLLGNKKVQDAENLFVCEGLWATQKLIQKGIKIRYFLFCPDNILPEEENLVVSVLNYAEQSFCVSQKACEKISDRDGADKFYFVCEMPELLLKDIHLSDNMVIIILDGQEQPGNIGAIIRSVDGAGGHGAIMVNRRVKPTHSRLIRSSLGASFMMPFVTTSMEEVFTWLSENNFKVILTDLTATKSYFEVDYSGRVAIVAGNEYKGISPAWRDKPFSIPVIIPMLGSCESLNVGFASTLVAYEAGLRQKGLLKR